MFVTHRYRSRPGLQRTTAILEYKTQHTAVIEEWKPVQGHRPHLQHLHRNPCTTNMTSTPHNYHTSNSPSNITPTYNHNTVNPPSHDNQVNNTMHSLHNQPNVKNGTPCAHTQIHAFITEVQTCMYLTNCAHVHASFVEYMYCNGSCQQACVRLCTAMLLRAFILGHTHTNTCANRSATASGQTHAHTRLHIRAHTRACTHTAPQTHAHTRLHTQNKGSCKSYIPTIV